MLQKTIAVCASLLFLFCGCVTVEVPKHLEGGFRYTKDFPADFNRAFAATAKALRDLGWKIEEVTSEPVAADTSTDSPAKQNKAYIFTEIKQRSMILYSTYLTLNVFIDTADAGSSTIEIRYLSATVFPPLFKEWRVDKNDGLIDKIYAEIDKNLKQ